MVFSFTFVNCYLFFIYYNFCFKVSFILIFFNFFQIIFLFFLNLGNFKNVLLSLACFVLFFNFFKKLNQYKTLKIFINHWYLCI